SAAAIAMRPVGLPRSDDLVWSDMTTPHAAFLAPITRTLSQRENRIRDTKKMIDGNSSTPSVMCWKCPKNDIERTVSTTTAGAQGRTAETTRSKPAMTNRKLAVVAPMNASTWLLVSPEIAAESARNAPAMRHDPTYEHRLT